MTYIGSIDTYTTEDSFWGNFISSLDESSGANEITAVTHLQDYDCGITESGEFCEFIEVFSHGYFNKLSTVFFPEFEVQSQSFIEKPKFVSMILREQNSLH